MKPCYIVTYYQQGPCAVDASAVTKFEDEQVGDFNYCRLHFADGSQLRLEEDCAAFKLKKENCQPNYPHELPVFPKKAKV